MFQAANWFLDGNVKSRIGDGPFAAWSSCICLVAFSGENEMTTDIPEVVRISIFQYQIELL